VRPGSRVHLGGLGRDREFPLRQLADRFTQEEATVPTWFIPLVSLTAMEIVLGIDNVIFLAIIASRLPVVQQDRARKLGLILALGMRLLLLFTISWVLGLTRPLFELPAWLLHGEAARGISGRDLILLAGGVFLIAKSTFEIHHRLEANHATLPDAGRRPAGFCMTLAQIAVLDIIFSLDSVITAVGMVKLDSAEGSTHGLWVIVAAMILTVGVMLVAAGPVSQFVERHPTLKILALSFLILIGVLLVAEAFDQHLNKGYIYFAMAFSFVVEMLNLRLRAQPVASPRSTGP
jgi:predicted tellurium resistance membrane protein TerC